MSRQEEEELHIYKTELEAQNDALRRAQLELEDQRSKYFSLFNLAPVGYIIQGENGMVENANLRACKMLGIDWDSLAGKPFSIFVDSQYRDIYYLNNKSLWTHKVPRSYEAILQPAVGVKFWAKVATILENGEDSPSSWITLTNISEQKKIEIALNESATNFNNFFEAIDDIALVCALDGKILYANSAATAHLGYKTSELLTMNAVEVNAYEDREEAQQIFAEMLTGKRERCPLPLQTNRGVLVPAETRIWLGKWGGEKCLFSLSKDLTEEQESLRRFECLFNSNPAPMAVSSIRTRCYTNVNNAFLATFGYERKDVINKPVKAMQIAVDQSKLDALVAELKKTGSILGRALQVKGKDGAILEGLFYGEVIEDQGESYFLTVMVDQTVQKRAEEEICRLNDKLSLRILSRTHELSTVNQEIEDFTYTVSHDLRAPLRHIGGFSNLLQAEHKENLNEEGKHYLDVIANSVVMMDKLINDLLEFSRSGKAPIVIEDVDMAVLVKDLTENLMCEAEWAIEELPIVQSDKSMLHQILVNLIDNAVKFSRNKAAPKINIGYCTSGHEIFFYVKDNGCGYDRLYADKLFSVFQRLNTDFEGTGIGLATVRRAVSRLGGRVWAESIVGEGSTFYFSIPKEIVQTVE